MSQPLPQALPSFAGTLNDKACVIATTSFRRRRSSTLSSPFDSIPVLTDNHHALCPPRLPLANVQSAPPPPPPPRTGPLVSSRNLSSKATHKRDGSPRKESKANSPTDCQPVPILASRSNSASLTIYRSPTVEPKGGNPSSTRLFRCFRGCTIVSEHYKVPLKGGIGCIPMERRCTLPVFSRPSKAKGAVLLIPGFSSNRSVFDVRGEEDRGGVSFFEYLGYRGYDTYSIDLRGSREAQGMGSRSPAYLKEVRISLGNIR
ncbi:hypothetical protein DFJ73DRAFT_505178 [Zopfochytrium polystomum]|nr:hypothetical protein DFJ73DRAFT_505178 [Zopfochytrium polystomum]